MTRRMLIDAGHREETRVAVTDGRELYEFDVETAAKSQLKGNIYLAKVTRVEPSLQAAFVDYGGNRHGFLAFSEIHPDYFQIPVSDREALAAEQAKLVEKAKEEDEDETESEADAPEEEETTAVETTDEDNGEADDEEEVEEIASAAADAAPAKPGRRRGRGRRKRSEDVEERQEAARHAAILKRGYKIQEVIKRRQILLIQVVKEERGNKGAALTTYLSIAGRYCVLMPNTPRGGGISRKIADSAQRRRLKQVAGELQVPEGMGVIIRTAGQGRTKAEIKRDFQSLLKQWEEIREATLKATAPSLIYEEANIVKRAIRDLYSKDIGEVLVEGDEGYKMAKAYMKLLMPSHASRVQQYKEPTPLFHRYDVERQLDAMHSPVVQLKSGGYIVINPTEALVAIDINSGRSTKERNIEETALKTNIEAAEEIARQLRLRDLAGLVVIDFIDMEENRNERTVERRLKEALKADRARIQLGRISSFGLLEMSRQRLRPSLTEALSEVCPQCGGLGHVRTTESTALHVLRGVENDGLKGRSAAIRVLVPTEVALYLLNQKRQALLDIEARYDMTAVVERDDDLIAPDFRIEVITRRETEERAEPPAEREAAAHEHEAATHEQEAEEAEEDGGNRKKRRRRRRRKPRGEGEGEERIGQEANEEEDEEESGASASSAEQDEQDEDGGNRKKRRRGRRGGRRRRGRGEEGGESAAAETAEAAGEQPGAGQETAAEEGAEPLEAAGEETTEAHDGDGEQPAEATGEQAETAQETAAEEAPRRRRRRAAGTEPETQPAEPEPEQPEPAAAAVPESAAEESAPPAPETQPQAAANDDSAAPAAGADEAVASPAPTSEPEPEPEQPAQPPRRGWWNKIVGS